MTESKQTPDLLVEKLAAGQLSTAEETAVRQRLEAEDGLSRLDDIAQSNQDILNDYPVRQMAASIRERYAASTPQKSVAFKLFWTLAPVSAVAAAAAVVFMLAPSPVPSDPSETTSVGSVDPNYSDDSIRIKSGDPFLRIFKKNKTDEIEVKSGDKLAEGDVLQLKMITNHARSMVVCSVDGNGAVTLHYPERPAATTRVTELKSISLPYGYELDDAPDFERFFIVWTESETPIDAQQIIEKIKSMKHAAHDTPELSGAVKFKDIMVKK
ncbi:MAG: hypothetical protein JXX29_23260 [Deltaproteobacteria bacterium]|nr:hypothetical protein [Deltaproteobacteria bacterium]MBN2674620.1 hypothetical protein [Deltaproteobacteria bacterium]